MHSEDLPLDAVELLRYISCVFFFCRNSYQLYSRYPVARHTRNHHMYFTIYSRQLSFFCDIILWSVIEQLVTVKLFNMS